MYRFNQIARDLAYTLNFEFQCFNGYSEDEMARVTKNISEMLEIKYKELREALDGNSY